MVLGLLDAASEGNSELVEMLIQNNVNVNFQNQHFHQTALHRAAALGRMTVVILLLGCEGIKIDMLDYRDFTARHYAEKRGHNDIMKLLDVTKSLLFLSKMPKKS